MKKFIFLIIIVISFTNVYSQKMKFGFLGGSNFSYLTTDSSSMPLKFMKPGVKFGLLFEFNNGYKSWITLSPQLSQQGALFKKEFYIIDTSNMYTAKKTSMIRNNLYYLKLPVTWKQEWGDIYTKIGFYGSFKGLATSNWYEISENIDGTDTTSGKYDSFSKFTRPLDIGVDFGFGSQIMLNDQVEIFGEIGYSMGFLSINPKEIKNENKMYNRLFNVTVGIMFGRNKYKYHK